jgi:acetolactate synthase-1/2/3 large subunit
MTAAEQLIRALLDEGVEVVFGYPGGAILPFYDALYGSPLTHILTRHEQGAVMAADGYARVSGKVGVCVATSGPGVTNLVTGIANAYMDSVPLIALTGQVPTAVLGTDAFQEIDAIGITMPIVKHSYLVKDASELPAVVAEAFQIARSGRPGPVLIDLPKDVLAGPAKTELVSPLPRSSARTPDPSALKRAAGLLKSAKRPLVYAGGGICMGDAVHTFRAFVDTCDLPVVCTLKGLGSIHGNHPNFMGMLGMHGLRAANLAVQSCDVLICVGARFDDRVTGVLAEFAPEARVIHMDVDPAEVGKLRQPDAPVVGCLESALRALTMTLDVDPWRVTCRRSVEEHAWNYDVPGPSIYGPRLLKMLSDVAPEGTVFTCDVGQHQMWVAQHVRFGCPREHLTSGGLGAMGYGLPAAIGAQIADPQRTVINVTGDGSVMMNIQELATLARYDLPVKMVVMDNQCLGMVRQWQELFLHGRYSEVDLSDNPDFVHVAQAFRVSSFSVSSAADVPAALTKLLAHKGPALLHVMLQQETNVWPFVPPGHSNSVMLEGT